MTVLGLLSLGKPSDRHMRAMWVGHPAQNLTGVSDLYEQGQTEEGGGARRKEGRGLGSTPAHPRLDESPYSPHFPDLAVSGPGPLPMPFREAIL